MSKATTHTCIAGKIIHCKDADDLECLEFGILCFESHEGGKIVLLEPFAESKDFQPSREVEKRGLVNSMSSLSLASDASTVEEDYTLPSSYSSACSLASFETEKMSTSHASASSLISLDDDSGIQDMKENSFLKSAILKKLDDTLNLKSNQVDVIILGEKSFVIPGFVDTHFHAPQYAFTGTGYDLPLLGWLAKYTFPIESKFEDKKFAERAYSKVVRRLLEHGTTTCSYYGTIHLEATKVLADEVYRQGARGLIGKVNMDQNSPDFYCETTSDSLADTRELCRYVMEEIRSPRVRPVITPRFAPTCSRCSNSKAPTLPFAPSLFPHCSPTRVLFFVFSFRICV